MHMAALPSQIVKYVRKDSTVAHKVSLALAEIVILVIIALRARTQRRLAIIHVRWGTIVCKEWASLRLVLQEHIR